jgi:hypothetical protein
VGFKSSSSSSGTSSSGGPPHIPYTSHILLHMVLCRCTASELLCSQTSYNIGPHDVCMFISGMLCCAVLWWHRRAGTLSWMTLLTP